MSAKVSIAKDVVTRAVLPLAGYGTKLYPMTRFMPKEMLPVGKKPMLEYAIEELNRAGINKILFIIRTGKEAIREYFGDGSNWKVKIDYIYKESRGGPAESILKGKDWCEGKPFLVIFGDCFFESNPKLITDSPIMRLINAFNKKVHQFTVITQSFRRPVLGEYLFIKQSKRVISQRDFFEISKNQIITKLDDKLNLDNVREGCARWLLSGDIFSYIEKTKPKSDGEKYLPPVIINLVKDGGLGAGVPLKNGERFHDLGCWDSYLKMVHKYSSI